MKPLQGKTVLITGGAKRLGRAMVMAAAHSGANVAFTHLSSREEARRTLADISALGVEGPRYLRCPL